MSMILAVMLRLHVSVMYFLGVWVALTSNIYHVDGEAHSPIEINQFSHDGEMIRNSLPTELKLLHVVFRHGDRTPDKEEMELYPDDPNKDNQFYPFGLKAITNAGKEREHKIGVFLRKHYEDFLNKIYIPEEIYVRTTDYDRTKMSALTCLAGLYPPEKIQQWHPKIIWQPIPYHTLPYNEDDMLYYYTCPRFLEARLDELYTPRFQNMLKPYKKLFEMMSSYTGRNLTTPEEIFYIDNLFQSEMNYNLPPPDWAIPLMDQIREMTVIEYMLQFATDELKRVAGGTLLQKMLKDSYAKIKNTMSPTNRKMFLYSAHENNVAAMLACSGVFKPHQPPYASTFILELHEVIETKTPVFRILYLKNITKPPEIMLIPDCGEFCPYEKFVKLTQNTVTSQLRQECALKHG